jgi:UDP-N-acetylglucosamine 1-carboxyvinyltransferase
MAVLATQARGKSIMNEWLYENRLGYVAELVRMGAHAQLVDSHNVVFTGPTPLHGENITSLDIRMGMTLVIAALVAEGQSIIEGVEHIDRGYEKIEERLQGIGAHISRVEKV